MFALQRRQSFRSFGQSNEASLCSHIYLETLFDWLNHRKAEWNANLAYGVRPCFGGCADNRSLLAGEAMREEHCLKSLLPQETSS